ncbi:MAG: CpaF family protein, partial [Proteobacteria bacterium]|nr:CpaF family protein [Pseudomonadota bacterium]
MTDLPSEGPLRDLFRRKGGRVAALEPTAEDHPKRRGKARTPAGDTLALKQHLQERLLDEIDRHAAGGATEEDVVELARQFIEDVLASEDLPLNARERGRLADELIDETVGLGPLAPLMSDPAVSDILVNQPDQVFVERFGHLEETDVRFRDPNHILRVIERIAARVGRRIDPSRPMVDLRLPDGSRVNATVPPASPDGPTLSIRRFGRRRLRREDLLRLGSISEAMVQILDAAVRGRRNLLVSGGTGAGKSTLLGALAEAIPTSERIVTIEDTLELMLDQRHWVRMETRPPNVEGRGEVTARSLVINSLRMRPVRVIVGEVRGPEALDMLQAMNTGHDGSLCTLHANSPRDALARL